MNLAVEATTRGAIAVAGAAASSYLDITVPYFGVPLNVVTAAVFGAIVGLAWNNNEMGRRKLALVTLCSVAAACAVTALMAFGLAHFKHIVIESKVLAPLALLIALFGNRWIPAVNDRIGPWLDKLPFIGKKGD